MIKRNLLYTSIFCIVGSIILSSYSTGSFGGFSSSVGDSGQSCGLNGCHRGGHTPQPGMITTNIPSSGYVAGATYNITLTHVHLGAQKMGFEMSSENSSGKQTGSFITDATSAYFILTGVPIARSKGHATHGSTGNVVVAGKRTWNIKWKAPSASGEGKIKFSAAVLAGDGNQHNSNDTTYVETIEVIENPISQVPNISLTTNFRFYPNPVSSELFIEFNTNFDELQILIFNSAGQQIISTSVLEEKKMDLSMLMPGVYFIKAEQEQQSVTKIFIKK